MPVWRCPHCGTPQSETSRCWVCHRSTTSCATCRNFRRAVVTGLGLCGLDRRHAALRGTEIRACWTAPDPAGAEAAPPVGDRRPVVATGSGASARPPEEPPSRHPRTFVPVEDLVAVARPVVALMAVAGPVASAATVNAPSTAGQGAGSMTSASSGTSTAPVPLAGGWSLWGEPEA